MDELLFFQAFEGLSVIFETFIVYQYISGLFGHSAKSKTCFLYYALFCLGLSVLSICVRTPAILITYTLLGVYLLERLVCNARVATRIFSILYFAAVMIVSEMLCSALISGLWGLQLANTLDYGLSRVLSILIAKLVQIFAVRLTILVANWKKDDFDHVEFLFIFPILMCQVCSILLAYHIFVLCFYCYGEFDLLAFLSIFGIMYINIIIFWYFDRIKKAYQYKAKSEAMETKLGLQEEYYRTLAEHQKETIALWHDMKKHIALIKELNNMKQNNMATTYLDELQDDLKRRLKIVQTEDPIIGALLTEQLKRADREEVCLELDVRLGSQTKLHSIDRCIILGNLFDNAFDACARLQEDSEKYIRAEIKQREQCLFIRILNAYNPETNDTKRTGKHGFGLSNIKRSVSKYGGEFDIEKSKTEFTATVIIP